MPLESMTFSGVPWSTVWKLRLHSVSVSEELVMVMAALLMKRTHCSAVEKHFYVCYIT